MRGECDARTVGRPPAEKCSGSTTTGSRGAALRTDMLLPRGLSAWTLTITLAVVALAVSVAAQERRLHCGPRLHECAIGPTIKCFLPAAMCDGEKNCDDGSDEEGCDALGRCQPGALLCSGRCARRCDGVVECADGRDESQCPHCRGGAVLCDGRCQRQCRNDTDPTPGCVWRCDGHKDCADGADEENCYRCGAGAADLGIPCRMKYPERPPNCGPRPPRDLRCARKCERFKKCGREDENWVPPAGCVPAVKP